jgi:hypothetical protein
MNMGLRGLWGRGGFHVIRMKDETIIKEMTERIQRREKTNWKALDREAKNTLECRNWRSSVAEDRDVWMQRFEEAKAQVRL